MDLPRSASGAVLLLAVLSGCTKYLDNKELEGDISKDTASKGVNLASVTCPANEPLKEGTKFACTCKDKKGTEGVFDVNVASGNSVAWKLRNKFMNMRVVGDSLEANLSKKTNQPVDVVCPAENVLIKLGVTFSCDVTVGTTKEQITLTAKTEDGSSWDEKISAK